MSPMGRSGWIAILAIWAFGARAQSLDGRCRTELRPVLQALVTELKIPGLAVGIVAEGKLVCAEGFGARKLGGTDAIDAESLFHMASVTKTFVATALMQLVEQGKVDLDAPVVQYVSYFRLKDERYKAITVRQMARHISGMPDVEDYEWNKPVYDDGALARYVKSLSGEMLIAAPGTMFRYSNMAFEVLGDLVAEVSGETFEGYVERHILTPLGMKSSTLLVKKADPSKLTTPHVLNSNIEIGVSPVFPYNRMHAPSSTLYSNINDMSRYAMANLNRGELDGSRILQTRTYDTLWTPQGDFKQVGISWFVGKYRDEQTVAHAGGDTGFRSNLVLLPARKAAVIAMSNYDRVPMGDITNALLDTAMGMTPKPIAIKTSIALEVGRTMVKDGIEAGQRRYGDLKKTQPNAYDFRENQLNQLGYMFMQDRKYKEAIAVLRLNAEAYPESSNAYDSLGEAYLRAGDTRQAAENYERSLKLDPKNKNAEDHLRKLKVQ